MATRELRERDSNCPWIGDVRIERNGSLVVLTPESVTRFLVVMIPSNLIPFQKISLRFDLFSIHPSILQEILTFSAPWLKTLRICPWASVNLDTDSPLLNVEGRKVLAWTLALQDLSRLVFPALETLELGPSSHPVYQHELLVVAMMTTMMSFVRGARNLRTFVYNHRFILYSSVDDATQAKRSEREITKGITLALPTSIKRLGFDKGCPVDYQALTSLNLNLEEFLCIGEPESDQAFLRFIDTQKRNLRSFLIPNLDIIYRSDFPQFPLITKFNMTVLPSTTFRCLHTFPALVKLKIVMSRGGGGAFYNILRNIDVIQTDWSHLHTHPSVQEIVVQGFKGDRIIKFDCLKHVFPNITHFDFDCLSKKHLTELFTNFPHLQRLHIRLDDLMDGYENMDSIISGIPTHICSLTKDYGISDDIGFEAISTIASRDPGSTIGLNNVKDLQVLEISNFNMEFFLTNLIFHVVLKKMSSLKDIKLFGETNKDCVEVLETLQMRNIRVNVVPNIKKQITIFD